MKKIFTLLAVCCLGLGFANAQNPETGATCFEAVHISYGADIKLDGNTYWIKLRLKDFEESGITAFWYSTDGLLMKGHFISGAGSKENCVSLGGLAIQSAANAKIIFDANDLISKIEEQIAKQGQLTESEKRIIREGTVVLSLEPVKHQPGRFVFNQFGVAVGSDCANPWDVALNAQYGLTPEPNVFRLDPALVGDSLHIVYEPMNDKYTDMTLMNVEVRVGDCEGAVAQSAASVDNFREGIVVLDRALVAQALEAQQPLFVTINRGADPATVAFRNVYTAVAEEVVDTTLCPGDFLEATEIQAEAGQYVYVVRETVEDGVKYVTTTANVTIGAECKTAIDMIQDANVSVRPTAVRAGQEIEIVAEGNNNMQVFDLTGRRIQNTTFQNATSVRIANSGEYFIRISGNNNSTRKVVVF